MQGQDLMILSDEASCPFLQPRYFEEWWFEQSLTPPYFSMLWQYNLPAQILHFLEHIPKRTSCLFLGFLRFHVGCGALMLASRLQRS
jgi:hypothetical protein